MSWPQRVPQQRVFLQVERGVLVCRNVVLYSCTYLLMNSQISSLVFSDDLDAIVVSSRLFVEKGSLHGF